MLARRRAGQCSRDLAAAIRHLWAAAAAAAEAVSELLNVLLVEPATPCDLFGVINENKICKTFM
jgi:hypothetical protein